MTSITLRIGLVLSLVAALATATAQDTAGVTLGWTAQIDATVLDVPPGAAGVDQVAARTADDVDVTLLALEQGVAGGPRLHGTLPDLRDSPLLQPITSEALWPCPMQASADARFAPFGLWAIGAPGAIELANAPLPDAPEPGYRQLLLLFADTDVRVQGTCLEDATALQVDLYLQPGWNLVASELVAVGERDRVLLRSAAAPDLRGIAWRWRDTRAHGPVEAVPRRE